jgi:hypothetical protein
VNLYAERPKTSTQSPLPRVSPLVVSPQRWTSLRALKLRKPRQSLRSPQAQKVHKALSVPRVLRLVQPVLLKVMMLRVPLQGRSQPSSPRRLPRALSPMDLGNPVGLNQAKAHPCLGPKDNRHNIRMLQSPCGIIQTLSRTDFTSVGM